MIAGDSESGDDASTGEMVFSWVKSACRLERLHALLRLQGLSIYTFPGPFPLTTQMASFWLTNSSSTYIIPFI